MELDQFTRRDTRDQQPAATAVPPGTVYCVTDEGHRLERSTGEVWELYTASAEALQHLAAARLLGRGSGSAGPVQEITLSNSFIMAGTELTVRSGIVNYTYNNAIVEPPAAGQCRANALYPWTATTKVWLRFVSADGQDLYWAIMLIVTGATLLLQDKDEHSRYVRFTLTDAPVDKGLYAELPVAWQANGSAINTASQVFLRVAGTIESASLQPMAARLDALERRLEALEAAR